jgi:CHASE3 domain sensor protein
MIGRIFMFTKSKPENTNTKTSTRDEVGEYREGVKGIIESEVKKTMSEEIRKAQMELIEEQQKTIRKILDEHKSIIQSVVQEEKIAIRENAEDLRQSIIRFSL